MKKWLIILLSCFATSLYANDGVFYASGNTLIPVKETQIELKKEILNLTRQGDWMFVEVNFEFYNPGEAKTVKVGFVTPPAGGDILEEDREHPFIKDFTVTMNGKNLPWESHKMENSGFKLENYETIGEDFVFHFDATFPKGKTTIRHTYLFRGGSSVDLDQDFGYRITTGKMWANGEIEDFELNINMGKGAYFCVPASFVESGTQADWQILGIGKISEEAFKAYFDGTGIKMVRTVDGSLRLNALHFKPDFDIWIGTWQKHMEVMFWGGPKDHLFREYHPFLSGWYKKESLEELSLSELRILRNYFFAWRGYVFKSEDLREYFSQFNWYVPTIKTHGDLEALDEKTSELVKAIQAEEKRKRSK